MHDLASMHLFMKDAIAHCARDLRQWRYTKDGPFYRWKAKGGGGRGQRWRVEYAKTFPGERREMETN